MRTSSAHNIGSTRNWRNSMDSSVSNNHIIVINKVDDSDISQTSKANENSESKIIKMLSDNEEKDNWIALNSLLNNQIINQDKKKSNLNFLSKFENANKKEEKSYSKQQGN